MMRMRVTLKNIKRMPHNQINGENRNGDEEVEDENK